MATGWLRGTVKEVPAGDTVVIVGTVKSGPPPEKRITLSSLVAPKLGKRDGSTRDEAFAWDSREFLRKKCIGKECVFKVDYVVEQIGNREFGSLFIGQENIALAVVSNGWAKVRATGQQQSPYYEDLQKAEEAAKNAGKGVWSKDLATAVREVRGDDAFDGLSFFQSVGKGKPVQGVVEAVLNGGTLKVCLLPDFSYVTISVCGIQCPSMGKRVVVDPGATAENGAAAPAEQPASNAEPYAREAKFFSEMRVLNRDVKVVLEGTDKYNNLFGVVYFDHEGKQESLAEHLVRLGFAKAVEWSINMMTTGGMKLRELEKAAKQEQKNIWKGYVAPPSNQTKLSDNFVATVTEVVSGDCLVVKDAASGQERRVNLSSIRAPKPATRDRAADPWAAEAKEFLRKKLIGKQVQVKLEYTRKVPLSSAESAATGEAERVMQFGNIELVAEKGEDQKNVSELIVARGFATVVRHRSDEERSGVYEQLIQLEELSKQGKKGLHGTKEPAANRINDVSQPGSLQRAKQYLPFFQRNGKMLAIVEHVLSGTRVKLQIPKEGVTIVFAPSGIKTPSRAMPAQNGKPATKAEPYAEDAIAFTREHVMQREVEVTIETMDKGGTFLGTLVVPGAKPFSLALGLLRAGLAKLQTTIDISRLTGSSELLAAEQIAKESKLKIWENWTPDMDATEENGADIASTSNGHGKPSQEVLEVTVTEVSGAGEFYVQVVNEPRVSWITEQLASLNLDTNGFTPDIKTGSLCLAKFSLDDQWYRAFVERANNKESTYEVYFIDYGNREKVPAARVKPMDSAMAAVQPQAQMCQLAYVKVPEPGTDYYNDATAYLAQLLGGGRPLTAYVVSKEKALPGMKHIKYGRPKLHLTLAEGETNIATEMLLAGLARLPKLRKVKDPATREAISKLQEYEDDARKSHRGMFQYGDPGDSDDEVDAVRKR